MRDETLNEDLLYPIFNYTQGQFKEFLNSLTPSEKQQVKDELTRLRAQNTDTTAEELSKAIIPTPADKAEEASNHANTAGFTLLGFLSIVAGVALPLATHGHVHIPTADVGVADYGLYVTLCAANVIATTMRSKQLMQIDTTKMKEQLRAEFKKQRRIVVGITSLLIAAASAYLVTSPDSHILPSTASAISATPVALALGFSFVAIMGALGVMEWKQAKAWESKVTEIEKELEKAIQSYNDQTKKEHNDTDNTSSATTTEGKLRTAGQRVNTLTNHLLFAKAKAAEHKKNAWLLGATGAALFGSSTFMLIAFVGVNIVGGAVTMGAVPAAFAMTCALIALYRWYRSKHPAPFNAVKTNDNAPIDKAALTKEQERASNIFGMFNKKSEITVDAPPNKSGDTASANCTTRP